MDPGPSTLSNPSRTWICICLKYCDGKPTIQSSKSTFYRHLKEASEVERVKIKAVENLSFEAAMVQSRLGLSTPMQSDDAGPSSERDNRSRSTRPLSNEEQDQPHHPARVPTPPVQSDAEQDQPHHPACVPTPPVQSDAEQDALDAPILPNRARQIPHERRRPPIVDLDALSQDTVIARLRHTMEFVNVLRNASLDDPIAKMSGPMLARIRDPPTARIQIENPGIKHSISTYLALEHASQASYRRVIQSMKANFPGVEGVESLLSFHGVENLIASYTGVEAIEHDMCPGSCIGFTGPFSDLESCPLCHKSQWDEAKLDASGGRMKVPAKRFVTLPLGPQLQALFRDPETARLMTYLHE
ncbi:hypothetical protein L210DRAFT_3338469, partial [Boletus edulis BED1]